MLRRRRAVSLRDEFCNHAEDCEPQEHHDNYRDPVGRVPGQDGFFRHKLPSVQNCSRFTAKCMPAPCPESITPKHGSVSSSDWPIPALRFR